MPITDKLAKELKKTMASRPTDFHYRTPLEFTAHSRLRMAEYGINDSWVENLWQRSNKITLSKKILEEKAKKYGKNKVSYYTRCGYLLTVTFRSGKCILVTITKQKSGNLPILVNHPDKYKIKG